MWQWPWRRSGWRYKGRGGVGVGGVVMTEERGKRRGWGGWTEKQKPRRCKWAEGGGVGGETARLVWPDRVTLATVRESFVAVPGYMGTEACVPCACEHECIKSNTGFHVGNNKVRGFTQLCRGLEIHRGSTFSSQRKVYAFSSEECQQPWSCLQRVRGGGRHA